MERGRAGVGETAPARSGRKKKGTGILSRGADKETRIMFSTKMTRKSTVSRMGRSAALAMLLLSTSVLTGVTTQAFAQADENAVSGGEMTIIAGSDIKSWDPAITSGTFPGGPMDQLDAVYGFLVYVDLDGVVQGGMAESLTSDDATV